MSFLAPASDLSDSTSSEQHESLEELLFPVGMKNRDLLRRSIHADFFLEIGAEIAGKSAEEIHLCFDRYIPQLNLEFANWLNDWGRSRFATGKRHQKILGILLALSTTCDFPRGNRASNLEISLVCNQIQLLFLQNLQNRLNISAQRFIPIYLRQTDWYKTSLHLDLLSKILAGQQKPVEAVQPLLQAIGLDIQHNPQLIDTDLQELAKLISQLDWQPSELMSKWQAASEAFSVSMPPLNSALQAQICLTIGVVSIQEKYWFKGLDWLKASWEIYQSTDDLRGLAEVSYQLAIGHHIASNLSYAGIYYRDAQRIFQHLEDARKVAFCHHGLGRLLLQMGKIKPATAEFDRALAIYHTIPDSAQVADKISDIQYYQRIITNMQDPNRTHQLI